MSDERARRLLGGGSHTKGGKHTKHRGSVHSMHIKRGDSGGFIVQNDHEQDPNDPDTTGGSTQHPIMDMDALKQHLDASMGDQPAAGSTPDQDPSAGAPPTAPADQAAA